MRKLMTSALLAATLVISMATPAAAQDIDLTVIEPYSNASGTEQRYAKCKVDVFKPSNWRADEDLIVKGAVFCNVKMSPMLDFNQPEIDIWVRDRYTSVADEETKMVGGYEYTTIKLDRSRGYKYGTFSIRYEKDSLGNRTWSTGLWDVVEPSISMWFRNPYTGEAEWLRGSRSSTARVESFTVQAV